MQTIKEFQYTLGNLVAPHHPKVHSFCTHIWTPDQAVGTGEEELLDKGKF